MSSVADREAPVTESVQAWVHILAARGDLSVTSLLSAGPSPGGGELGGCTSRVSRRVILFLQWRFTRIAHGQRRRVSPEWAYGFR